MVVAAQANAGLRLLHNPTEAQRTALQAFEYESSRVVVHTDRKLMPTDTDHWSPLNIFVKSVDCAGVNGVESTEQDQLMPTPKGATTGPMCTVWITVLQIHSSSFKFQRHL